MKVREHGTDVVCSVCKKPFTIFNSTKEYVYRSKNVRTGAIIYQCCYNHHLTATKKPRKKKTNSVYFKSDLPIVKGIKLKPNAELEAIRRVERRYGPDCWTRTDQEFINDSDVQLVRRPRFTGRLRSATDEVMYEAIKFEVKELYYQGFTIQDISRKVNINNRQVRKMIREIKLRRHQRGLKVPS